LPPPTQSGKFELCCICCEAAEDISSDVLKGQLTAGVVFLDSRCTSLGALGATHLPPPVAVDF